MPRLWECTWSPTAMSRGGAADRLPVLVHRRAGGDRAQGELVPAGHALRDDERVELGAGLQVPRRDPDVVVRSQHEHAVSQGQRHRARISLSRRRHRRCPPGTGLGTGASAYPPDMAASVTLSDVAREAGVSLATASRAINGSANRTVRADLRDRVLAAATRLRYTPDANAQAMARGRTTSLGLVVHDIADPYFSSIAAGVARAAERAGLQVTLASTQHDPSRESGLVDLLQAATGSRDRHRRRPPGRRRHQRRAPGRARGLPRGRRGGRAHRPADPRRRLRRDRQRAGRRATWPRRCTPAGTGASRCWPGPRVT